MSSRPEYRVGPGAFPGAAPTVPAEAMLAPGADGIARPAMASTAHLNLSGGPTNLVAGPGRVFKVIVTTAGAAGALHDSADTVTAAGSLIAVIPAAVGPVTLDLPFTHGLTYTGGAAQVFNVTTDE